ncbi:MAG TPA: 2-C-methyl-D-erythritol 2,4-cyclodiphosphate synthase [Bacteroidales bacterium]|nr:2-C-methyl-D-erythritol 2,4-cyclodiphosphate synthase [Bacteroidales bacterium]HPR57580.1 2-C-methyl-D-erythritol 2,4-cyclodiphosphate synthase [Bacteroidales bacterium]HRW96145.1 2-C-methyl-D-erythritol 2,4-cyclodiphosphate synthase [Bacteroidales bacterium]
MFRIGFGYDVHRLAEGRRFVLGGVEIPHLKGAVGHSDADVLVHAICDALLGAANLGDIGIHFPDKDPKYKNINSLILLAEVLGKISSKGYTIGNVDTTIALQQPKIAEFIPLMKKQLAQTLKVNESIISIKATTTEKLGFVGREEGISAYAVVLITKE